MKLILITPKSRDIINLRAELINEIISKGYEVIIIAPEQEYKIESEKLGVKFITLEMDKNSTSMIHDLKYLARIYHIVKGEKPKIVLNYTIKPTIYGSVAAKLARVNKIYSVITGLGYVYTTNDAKTKRIKPIVNKLYKLAFKFNSKVFFQNEDDIQEFANLNLLKKQKCVLVNGSGVNMNRFYKTNHPKNISFLIIARILKNKGIAEYLSAAEKVKEKYPEVSFHLVGALEDTQDALQYDFIKKYIDKGILKYHGEQKDIRPFITDCSVYVLPSYREGTPRTVLEAMSMGRAIITTLAPGCRGTVKHGDTGFLVPIKNDLLLYEKMIWFIEHPQQIIEMGNASHELCKNKFDVNKVNESMLTQMKL